MKISRSLEDRPVQTAPGRQRRVAHTKNLMVVVWDFADARLRNRTPPTPTLMSR